MIYGNITLSSKPDLDDRVGICSECGEEAIEVAFDSSFDDHFGTVEAWEVGSNCCGGEVLDYWGAEDRADFGHIPNIDPYTARRGQKVMFNSNNTWTLVHKFWLHCPKCDPKVKCKSWFWVVRYTRAGGHGETQVWGCDDKRFWRKVWDRKYADEIKAILEVRHERWLKIIRDRKEERAKERSGHE